MPNATPKHKHNQYDSVGASEVTDVSPKRLCLKSQSYQISSGRVPIRKGCSGCAKGDCSIIEMASMGLAEVTSAALTTRSAMRRTFSCRDSVVSLYDPISARNSVALSVVTMCSSVMPSAFLPSTRLPNLGPTCASGGRRLMTACVRSGVRVKVSPGNSLVLNLV